MPRWPFRAARDRVRAGGAAAVLRAARLTVAAVAAYAVAAATVPDPRPVTAALTALLIVQVTLLGTLADTVRRILSVLVGVGVAIAVAGWVGFTWWSLAAIVAVSLLLGQALRLGPHLMEVPISAMLILAAGGAGVQATDRVSETLMGAAVGVLVNVLAPPRTRTRSAGAAVERFARRIADLLDRVGRTLAERPAGSDEAREWLRELRTIAGDTAGVDQALAEASESRRLNPRAAGSTDPLPDLRSGLDALEHVAVALRSVLRSIADGAGAATADDETRDDPHRADQRGAVATLLLELGRCVAAFGTLARAEFVEDDAAADLHAALEAVERNRARLADLLLVDPRESADAWQLHGALLTAVDRLVGELDLVEQTRRREQRRRDAAAGASPAWHAARRVRSSARRMMADNPVRGPRGRRR